MFASGFRMAAPAVKCVFALYHPCVQFILDDVGLAWLVPAHIRWLQDSRAAARDCDHDLPEFNRLS